MPGSASLVDAVVWDPFTSEAPPFGAGGVGAIDATVEGARYGVTDGAYGRDRNGQRILASLFDEARKLNLFSDSDKVLALLRVEGVTVNLPGLDPMAVAAVLRGLDPDAVVGFSQPYARPAPDLANIGFTEMFDPVIGPELFAALRAGTLPGFASAHPDWVVTH